MRYNKRPNKKSSINIFSLLIRSYLKYPIYYGVWGVRDHRLYDGRELR